VKEMKIQKPKKVRQDDEFVPVDAVKTTQETQITQATENQPVGSLAELYEMYETEVVNRRRGATVPAEQVRQFVREVMDATGKDEVVLAAIVRAISKSIGKVENGSVRSAVHKEFNLVKKGDTVYITRRS